MIYGLLDPASQRGVTPSVIPHPDAVSTRYAVRWAEIERVAGCPRRTNRGQE